MAYTDRMGRTDYDRGYADYDAHYRDMPDDLARLKDLDDYEVADYDADPRGWDVIGRDGEKIGKIDELLVSPSTMKAYFAIVDTGGWFSNKKFALPLSNMTFDRDDHKVHAPYAKEQFQGAPEWTEGGRDYNRYYTYWSGLEPIAGTGERFEGRERFEDRERFVGEREATARGGEIRVPVTEESAEVRKERREAGFITVRKRSEVETKHISEPVTHTRVYAETRDVPEGEAYAYDKDATTLREGETLRVPVVEEDVVVEKVPRVTKEVLIHTEPETERVEKDVQLRHEEIEIDREGDVDIETPAETRRGF